MTPEQRQIEIARLDHDAYQVETNERLRLQADLGHSALRGLTLANGGAIVALFTFIGNTAAKFDAALVWWSFGFFVTGLVFTLAANVGGFLAQGYFLKQTAYQAWNAQSLMTGGDQIYDHMPLYRRGVRFETGSIICAVLALLAFIVGAAMALAGVLI